MNPKSSVVSSSVNHNLAQLLAVSSMAIGVAATISAAPAQAVFINPTSLEFDGRTSSFYTKAKNGQDFSITFNPFAPKKANVTDATGDLDPLFATPGSYSLNSPVLNFDFISKSGTDRIYKLLNPLNFTFSNGVKISLASGALFSGSVNISGVTLSVDPNTAALFGIGTADTAANFFDFAFSDLKNVANAGTYGLIANTKKQEVPEPFSIIGTLIGGTAAFRLKKKLASSSKA